LLLRERVMARVKGDAERRRGAKRTN